MTAPLRRVETLTARLESLSRQRDLAVSEAVAAGASWSAIAGALGISPQAAHKRYRWIRHDDAGNVWHERPLQL